MFWIFLPRARQSIPLDKSLLGARWLSSKVWDSCWDFRPSIRVWVPGSPNSHEKNSNNPAGFCPVNPGLARQKCVDRGRVTYLSIFLFLTPETITEPGLGFTRPCSVKPIYWLGCGQGKHSIYCGVQSRENKQLMLRSELPDSLQERGFKDAVREGSAGSMINLCPILELVGIKVKLPAPSTFLFQPVWGLCPYCQQFSSGGGLLPVKTT